jgi:ATP-dependent Clp protease ATP-binding subunit ClpA
MPKINVYLPDELSEAVKETGLPVSTICQRALEQSVKRVNSIRAAAVGDLSGEDPTVGLTAFTQRAKDVVKLAITHARERDAAEIGTRDLLAGMLVEGGNLGVHVLSHLDIDPAVVLREVEASESPEPSDPAAAAGQASRMSRTAANALELTVTEAISLGHNYVGCEHLLLGLLAEPDGAGGELLRGLGVEQRSARQAVTAFLAGYVHLRDNQGTVLERLVADAVGKALRPVVGRLDRLEERLKD